MPLAIFGTFWSTKARVDKLESTDLRCLIDFMHVQAVKAAVAVAGIAYIRIILNS